MTESSPPLRSPPQPSRHHASEKATQSQRWWRVRWFRGMYRDVRRRLPWYISDWTDAWNYRVVPATLYMYFTNILPALAFSLDMFSKTGMSYGVNEVLLSSVIASGIFSFFAAQPLVIVGVTGPITVFNYTFYDIIRSRNTNYLAFMCWIGLWSSVFHTFLAACNSCVALRYVTKLPCDTFGFFVAIVYLEKGVEVLIRQFPSSESSASTTAASAYLSIVIALLTFLIAYTLVSSVHRSSLFRAPIRKFVEDYGLPLTVIFLSGMVHVGKMRSVSLNYLPTGGGAFKPTAVSNGADGRKGWIIPFWKLSVEDVFLALPFGFLLTVLFWFDHNVSSLIAQASTFPLRKPAGFHWDLFLLGVTTGLTGILGLPFPNGLIPQAPFHTQALCVYPSPSSSHQVGVSGNGSFDRKDAEKLPESCENIPDGPHDNHIHDDDAFARSQPFANIPATSVVDLRKPTQVVEQRLSNLAQGLITLFTMSSFALTALRQIPQAALAGLFFVMGFQALVGNEMVARIGFLLQDPYLSLPQANTSRFRGRGRCRKKDGENEGCKSRKPLMIFLLVEIVVIGVSFGITHTVASIGFPLLFALLIPARHLKWLLPALIGDPVVLQELDGPIASSKTMEGVYIADWSNDALLSNRDGRRPSIRGSLRDAEEGIGTSSGTRHG